MPVLSYLVFPVDGKKEELRKTLSDLPSCDVIPSDNENVLVLVVETESQADEAVLQEKLQSIPSLHGLSLVAGFEDDAAPNLE